MNISILYEDDGVVAIDKPSGMIVHPDGHSRTESVSEWFVKHYPDASDVGEPQRLSNGEIVMRPGVVHRLDTETSGVLLLAKTRESYASLKEQFQNRTIEKVYLACVYGEMPKEKGVIDRPIGRSAQHFNLWSAQRGARGELREAVTLYEVLGGTSKHSAIKVIPKTGRTHQIRVHMKAIHHPVVCDKLYAPNHPCDLGFSRLALHAWKVSWKGLDGEARSIETHLPEDMDRALALLGVKW
jgi:23S rRNA pseudouridine1911/1915/1917 synthase